jgi:hypothetical protein
MDPFPSTQKPDSYSAVADQVFLTVRKVADGRAGSYAVQAKDAPSPTLSELCNMLGWEADHPSNPPTWDGSDDLPQDKPRGAGPQGVREIHAV